MATTTEEAILNIKVDWGQAADTIIKYRKEIEDLKNAEENLKKEQKALKEAGQQESARYRETEKELLRLSAREKERTDNIRTLKKEMQNEVRSAKVYDDSLKSLRAQLSNLTKQYDEMTSSMRGSKAGDDLAKKINEVTTKLKDAEGATQRYYRNVGNYENSIKSALGLNSKWAQGIQNINGLLSGGVKQAFATGASAVKAFGAELMALLAHPVVLILAAISAAIMAIVKGIQSSEENSQKLRIVLEPLNRILQYLLNYIQGIATAMLDLAFKAGKAIMAMSRWAEQLPIIGKYIKQFNDDIEQGVKDAQSENDIVLQERKNAEQNAQTQKRVAQLRNQAAQKDKYTLEQRKRMLEEAIDLEEQEMKRNVALAKLRLKTIESRSKESQNDKETNEALSQARVAVANAEKEFYQGTMRLQQQRANIEQELGKQTQENTTRTRKVVVDNSKAILNETRKYEDLLLSMIEDNAERQRKQLKMQYDRQIADLEARLQKEKYLTETILAEIQALKQKYIIDSAKLELQLTQATIQQEQKRIEILLSGAEKETQAEYNLKLQQLEQQKALDLLQIEQAQYTEEQKGELRLAIAEKYAHQYDELEKKRINDTIKKQEEALRIEFETAIAKASSDALEVSRLQMEMARQQAEQLQQYQGETLEAFNLRKAQADQAYLQAKQDYSDKEVQIEQAKFKAMTDITDGLVSLTESLGESDEGMARASKVLALATIAIKTGEAIAKMVSAESGKGVVGLATMAGGIATILTNIATAIKTVRSAKFSRGGRISGQGSATSDSNTIRVSDGESVINARSTQMFAPLLSQLNQLGGGVPIEVVTGNTNTIGEDMLATAFAKGAMMVPAPVVSVEEINAVAGRVKVLEQLAKI